VGGVGGGGGVWGGISLKKIVREGYAVLGLKIKAWGEGVLRKMVNPTGTISTHRLI